MTAFRCTRRIKNHLSQVPSEDFGSPSKVSPNMFTASSAYQATDGVGIFVVGPASNWLWRCVKEVRLGLEPDWLDQVVAPKNAHSPVPAGEMLAFAQEFDLDQTVFAQIVLIDDTVLPSFKLIVEPITP